MSRILSKFDTNVSFWDAAPQMKVAELAGKLFRSDKSRNKKLSSDKMWTTALLWDMDSLFYNLPIKEKVRHVVEEYLKDQGGIKYYEKEKELFDSLKKEYESLMDTPLIRTLKALSKKLEDRIHFFDSTDYDVTTVKILDDAAINTSKIAKTISELEIQIGLEKAKSKSKGDSELSLTDSNAI